MNLKDTFGRPFVVRFRTTLDDYLAYCWAAQGPAGWMKFGGVCVVLAAVVFALEYNGEVAAGGGAALLAKMALLWLVGVAAGSAFGLWFWRWLVRRRFEKDYLSQSDIELFAGEMGLQVRGAGVRADYDWSLFDRLKATRRHVFLFFYKHGLIIPRRAFDSPGDADIFIAFAKERLAAAKTDLANRE